MPTLILRSETGRQCLAFATFAELSNPGIESISFTTNQISVIPKRTREGSGREFSKPDSSQSTARNDRKACYLIACRGSSSLPQLDQIAARAVEIEQVELRRVVGDFAPDHELVGLAGFDNAPLLADTDDRTRQCILCRHALINRVNIAMAAQVGARGDFRHVAELVEVATGDLAGQPEFAVRLVLALLVVLDDVVIHNGNDAALAALDASHVADDEISPQLRAPPAADANSTGPAADAIVAGHQVVLDHHGHVRGIVVTLA